MLKSGIFALVAGVLMAWAPALAGEAPPASPLASVVTADNVDLENCKEFPENTQRNTFAQGGWNGALLGAFHAAGAMAPHFSWATGPSDQPDVRLRIAFKKPLPIGTIIGADGWKVSTLKDAAAFPGDVADDALWQDVPDVPGQAGLRVLPLPQVLTTQAIRLTQTRTLKPGEKASASMAGIVLLEARLHNLTPEAIAYASSEAVSNQQEREANGVQNLVTGGRWLARRTEPISPEKPEWVVLSWDDPRPVRGIGLRNAFAKRVEFDVYTGPPDVHPLTAAPAAWQNVAGVDPPVWWRPAYTDCYVNLGREYSSTAVRMRITQPLTNENPDIAYSTGGKQTAASLEGFMVFADLGTKPVPLRPRKELEPPPIQVKYTMPADGKVAVAINDEAGNRVRNLIADAPRQKGKNSENWDGLDDNGKLVPPGEYTVKTISHEKLSLKWQMTPHNARDVPWWNSPSWGGQLGPGSFLSDHGTPNSVCVLGEKVFIGSSIAESGHSLVALSLDGKKLWGTKWLDTAGASVLATDGKKLYVGAEGGWIGGTVMIFELDPATCVHRRIVQFGLDPARGVTGELSGLAARDGKVYAAFNAPRQSWLASALSPANLDLANCLPAGMDSPTFGSAGSLGALLRTGGTPTSHHWLPAANAAFGGEGDTRHIRIAFREQQPIGSIVLPTCGGQFSALKPDAEYPGDAANDAQWLTLPSETAGNVQTITAPAELQTRAIRVTWTRGETPKENFKPGLLGFKLFGHRFKNIAPAAKLSASSGTPGAGGGWSSARRPDAKPITPIDPETLTLTWEQPQTIRGLALVNASAKQIEVDVKNGGDWQRAATLNPPVWWRPSYHDDYLDFGKEITAQAIRLRVTRALVSENPDVAATTGGKPLSASIGGIAVLQGIGGDPPLPPDLCQRIAVYSAADGKLLKQFAIPAPRGLEFNAAGDLLAVSANQVVKVGLEDGKIAPLITAGLEDPFDLCFGRDGSIYVTDRGQAHHVKVFAADGKFLRVIGKTGTRKAGPYDPANMVNPQGIDIDGRGQIWVAEADYQPKRASWWQAADGKFSGEIMGPARYGGGGWLDPQDKARFYYGGMEFALDWDKGTWQLKNIIWRDTGLPAGAPERPIHFNDRRFIVTDPGNHFGPFAAVAEYRKDHAVPLAMAGPAEQWPLLATPEFLKVIGADLTGKGFIWVDRNGDAKPQPDEIQIGPPLQAEYFTSYICDDLTLNFRSIELPAAGFNDCGAPEYSFEKIVKREPLPAAATYSSALLPDGSLFAVSSPILIQNSDGKVRWTYPENYLGVHASQKAPRPMQGECSGSLTYIGHAKADGDIGLLVGAVSNFGYYTLFTDDGLLAARLFDDYRNGAPGWHSATAERGMEVGGFSLGGEHFSGSFTRASDGKYYVVAGHNHSSIVEVEGLETLKRSQQKLPVSANDLAACETYLRRKMLLETRKEAPKFIHAARMADFKPDGNLAEWQKAEAADVRGIGTARMAYNADSLLLAFEVKDDTPLLNTGTEPKMMFKTGDSLDLQIGTDPKAPLQRMEPAPGDMRLLITQSQGKVLGVLYRHRVPGTTRDKAHLFSSPARTEQVDVIDVLDDLPAGVKLDKGSYVLEVAVPLNTLGLEPKAGMRLRADFGVLRGDPKGEETRERLYWANPATQIINDVPSEIMLCPAMWGTVEFGE